MLQERPLPPYFSDVHIIIGMPPQAIIMGIIGMPEFMLFIMGMGMAICMFIGMGMFIIGIAFIVWSSREKRSV